MFFCNLVIGVSTSASCYFTSRNIPQCTTQNHNQISCVYVPHTWSASPKIINMRLVAEEPLTLHQFRISDMPKNSLWLFFSHTYSSKTNYRNKVVNYIVFFFFTSEQQLVLTLCQLFLNVFQMTAYSSGAHLLFERLRGSKAFPTGEKNNLYGIQCLWYVPVFEIFDHFWWKQFDGDW